MKREVNRAIRLLFQRDLFLLENGANERSISHKLAEYLQTQFPEWHVDCEYNRKGNAIKELSGITECEEERRTERVYPDIIIHHRNTDDNLLVIEIKTNRGATTCDIAKLRAFTTDPDYRYTYGLFIQFNRTHNPELKWFANGIEINSTEVGHGG